MRVELNFWDVKGVLVELLHSFDVDLVLTDHWGCFFTFFTKIRVV